MTNLKKISVNSTAEVGVVRTSDAPVGDPQKKWEPGTVEQYVVNAVAGETARAQSAEAQLLGLVHTPNQNYVTVQTYAALPSTGSADTIYRVSNYNGANSQVDATKYSEYAWDDVSNPNAYVLLCVKSQIDEVFDITVYNNNTKYANLSAALSGTNVPESIKRGGMSVKFVQTTPAKYTVVKTEGLTEQPTGTEIQNDPGIVSGTYEASQLSAFSTLPATLNSSLTYYLAVTETVDEQEVTTYTTWVIKYVQTSDNKYVQHFLTKDEWSINETDWEKINLEKELNQLDGQINGSNQETPILANYSNGYIATNGVVSGTGSSTYQHTEAIRLTDDIISLKCYSLLSASLAGGVGFYKTSTLPVSSGQATEITVEVVGIGTGSVQNNNELINISAEKIAELKSRGAKYFSVCILTSGQNRGISYFTPQSGIVDDIARIESDIVDINSEIEDTNNELNNVKEGETEETQVSDSEFEYGYITTTGIFGRNGTSTTTSRTSPALIGDIIGIRAKVEANDVAVGGIFFFKTSNKPTTGGNPALVGVIGHNSSSTSGYVNDEIIVTKEQIRQMQVLGAKYYAISSYTEGRALYTTVVTEDGLKQTQEKVENLEQVTQTCRKRMDITLQDTPDEILTKLLTVYGGKDYDVYWENGTYELSNAWVTMSTMGRFTAINTYELPIGGKNNEYFFNGSIISASGLYDLIGGTKSGNSNLFGTLRAGNHSYTLHDATFIISDGNYAFHDETSGALGTQRHIYDNIKFINEPTEHSTNVATGFGCGYGYNTILEFKNCYFNNTSGESCIRTHGINTPVEGETSRSRFVFDGCYFATQIDFGVLAVRENVDFVFCGNSYTTLYFSESGQGTYTKYIYCNEQRT